VTLDAKPEKLDLDLSRTAILVIDMQNDFCSKGGLLDLQAVDVSIVRSVVAPIQKVLTAARKAGLRIVYLKMGFRADRSDIGPAGSISWRNYNQDVGRVVRTPGGTEGRTLVRDTWNTEIIDELKPEPRDIVLYKNRFSGFYQTELDSTLKRFGIRFMIVTGCTTSVCVESTIRDASFCDYSPVLLSDCTAEPEGLDFTRTNYEASLFIIQELFGWTTTSDQFVSILATR